VTRAFVIVNPAAGSGRTERLWPSLRADLRRLGLTFDFALTKAPGEATTVARSVALAYGLVVAVGGDGTLNEVVNGIVHMGDLDGSPMPPGARQRPGEAGTLLDGWGAGPAVAAILTGRGRDACGNLGIARDPRLAARRVVDGMERSIDVGAVEWAGGARRYFVGAAGAGFDAAVARRAAARAGSGTVPYLLAVMACIRAHAPVDVEIGVDGGAPWRGPVTAVVVANGSRYGGGMRIAPAADPTDGVLDLVVLGAMSRTEMLRWLPTIYRGTHLRHPRVWSVRARRVTLASLAPLPVHLDGEGGADGPLAFQVCAGALRLRV
jgi:diacylglycerol kinase family enzyme